MMTNKDDENPHALYLRSVSRLERVETEELKRLRAAADEISRLDGIRRNLQAEVKALGETCENRIDALMTGKDDPDDLVVCQACGGAHLFWLTQKGFVCSHCGTNTASRGQGDCK